MVAIAAIAISAAAQPSHSSKPSVPGSMANCPNEPAALTMPMAILRFSGATARPTAPKMTENVVPERPRPINSPALTVMPSAEVERLINSSPKAYSKPPTTIILAAPKRSASAPVKGCDRPQTRFCKASAKANTPRPQPSSLLRGSIKSPKPWRNPMAVEITKLPKMINRSEWRRMRAMVFSLLAGLRIVDYRMRSRVLEAAK